MYKRLLSFAELFLLIGYDLNNDWMELECIYIYSCNSGGGGGGGVGRRDYSCVCMCVLVGVCVRVCVCACVLCNVPIYASMLALKCKQESVQL